MKVIVEFPRVLLEYTDALAKAKGLTRSELIRQAVKAHIEAFHREKYSEALAEGYRLNAELDRKIAEEMGQ